MKKMKKLLYVLLIAVLIMPVIPAISTRAATTKTPAPAYNGKWTYYAVYNTIYKLNSQDGTAQKVKEIKDVNIVSDISYYDGYLYFTADYYYGTDGSNCYVCRMKTKGTSFETLGRGRQPLIYNKKIYYFKTKYTKDKYDQYYEETTSISEMSLTGKNSRVLVKNNAANYLLWDMGVINGKVYYQKYLASSNAYAAMSYDISSGKTAKLFTNEDNIQLVSGDASYLYYSIGYDTVGVYTIKPGKLSSKKYSDSICVIGGKNGTAYFSRYDTYSTYAYHAKENKVTTVKKNKLLTDLTFSKSGYQVVKYSMTQEEFEASGYQYDMAVARMKIDGTCFKTLKKYFVS